MDRFFDALFIGLSYGSIYVLVALGLVVVFRGSGHLNFAQGEMATLSAYVAWMATTWTIPLVEWEVPLWLAALMAMGFGFIIGAATELFIVRPLSRRSPLAVFVALIALFLGINAFNAGMWDAPPQEIIGSLFPDRPEDFVRLFGTTWRWEYIGTLIVALVAAAALFVLFQRTKIGLAMRAVSSNTESGKLVGIPTGWVLAGSWGLAGSIAALGGTLYAGIQGSVNPILMFTIFVYGSAAATLGGLDSPNGAVVAGLAIGIVENQAAEWAPGWIGQELKLGVALLCIFVVLLVRPSGLFGTAKVERV